MDFGWSAEQRAAFETTLREVGAAFPAGLDPDRPHRRDEWLRLGKLGLLGLCVPTRYGGAGLGAVDSALRVEALGRACADTGLVFSANAHLFACAVPVAEFTGEEVRRRMLPGMCTGELIAANAMTEDDAGSDVSRLATTATEVPGGYLLNGEKSFVTNGPIADVYVAYATTDPRAGHFGVTGLVVERNTPGVTVGKPFHKMGLLSAQAGRVHFTDCFVPAANLLGEPGQGAVVFQHSMRWERSCLFAGYLGLLDRLVDRCVEHARSRRQFGRRIGEFQAVANRIVDMKLRADAGRLLLYRACWELDQGRPSEVSIALAKIAISEGAAASAMEAVQIFGGLGYLREHGIETLLRDTVPSTIFSGSSDIQRNLVAAGLGL